MNIFKTEKRRSKYISLDSKSPEFYIVNLLANKLYNILAKYIFQNSEDKKKIILDLGCGSQPFKEDFLKGNLQYYSSDVVAIEGANIDFIVDLSKPVSETDFNDIKFDYIVCTEVAEHIPDWNVLFSNINLITKKDSIVIMTSPFIYFLHEVPHDYFRATPYAYQHFADKYSFEVVEMDKAGDYFDIAGTIHNYCSGYVSWSKSIFVRKAAFFINTFSKLKDKIKYSTFFRRNFERHTPYYLSNIVVLRRR
jgi:SAM-dependent methyltransferase